MEERIRKKKKKKGREGNGGRKEWKKSGRKKKNGKFGMKKTNIKKKEEKRERWEGERICDPFWENVPKVGKTTIEIQLKVGNNSIFNKIYKPIFS